MNFLTTLRVGRRKSIFRNKCSHKNSASAHLDHRQQRIVSMRTFLLITQCLIVRHMKNILASLKKSLRKSKRELPKREEKESIKCLKIALSNLTSWTGNPLLKTQRTCPLKD